MIARLVQALIALIVVALAVEGGVAVMKTMQRREDPEAHAGAHRRARGWTYGVTIVVLFAFVGMAIGWGAWPIVVVLAIVVPLVFIASFRKALQR